MNSSSAQSLLDSIDQTITDIDGIAGSQVTVDAYLAKFLVVYICGIYEEAIENILTDFVARNTGRPEIVAYVRNSIEKSFRNPKADKLIELAKSLGQPTWQATLNAMTAEKIALDSIVNNKNDIAHGHGCTITLREVKDYYNLSRPLIEQFDFLLS